MKKNMPEIEVKVFLETPASVFNPEKLAFFTLKQNSKTRKQNEQAK